MKKIKIHIEKAGNNYSAYVKNGLGGTLVCTTGKTVSQTMRNLAEAWELHEKVNEVGTKDIRKKPFGYRPGVKRLPVRNKVKTITFKK